MPEWLSWLHLPELTDQEYARKKAKYVAENGYTITVPGLSDIIKIPTVEPMTDEEHRLWKEKRFDEIPPARLEELQKEKQKRRARFEAMLASPTPVAITNIGSVMTAIDDAQDGLSTLAVIGQVAKRVAPRVLGKLLTGPVGVVTVAADILNLVQAVPQQCLSPLTGKRIKDRFADSSPKTKKARVRTAPKLNNGLPGKGDIIQGLQATEQVFGFGISLGPLMGLGLDILFGSILSPPGRPVKVKLPVPDLKHWSKAALKIAKASTLMFGFPHATDDDEILQWIIATEMAWQELSRLNQTWNPLDQVEGLDDLQVKALEPWHTQTIEVLQENKIHLGRSIGWPQTNTLYARIRDIADATTETATKNLSNFVDRNKNTWRGFTGASAATEGPYFMLSTLEGEQEVRYDYHVGHKVAQKLIQNFWRLDPNQPLDKYRTFISWMEYNENIGHDPTLREIKDFCNGSAGIKLI